MYDTRHAVAVFCFICTQKRRFGPPREGSGCKNSTETISGRKLREIELKQYTNLYLPSTLAKSFPLWTLQGQPPRVLLELKFKPEIFRPKLLESHSEEPTEATRFKREKLELKHFNSPLRLSAKPAIGWCSSLLINAKSCGEDASISSLPERMNKNEKLIPTFYFAFCFNCWPQGSEFLKLLNSQSTATKFNRVLRVLLSHNY